MPQTIHVIYEDGVLKPLGKVDIPEHRTLEILVVDDELPLSLIAQVAEQGGSYNFLRQRLSAGRNRVFLKNPVSENSEDALSINCCAT